MNTHTNTVTGSQLESQGNALAVVPVTRPFYWSVRRELWENRSTYLAPLAAAAVFLFGFVIHTMVLRHRMHGIWTLSPEQQYDTFAAPYGIAAGLIMGTAFIVGVFYSLDALYGERRDRSIFFWKSLPVSDLTVVLSKVTIPIVILPLLSFAITIATQLMMLVLSSIVLMGSGLDIGTLWTHSSFLHVSLMLLYHIVTVHGLWYAPFYGWLLLISVLVRRAPFIWAFLPPFVIGVVEQMTFRTNHFFTMMVSRLMGPEVATPMGSSMMDQMAALTPARFFALPGLWIGLAIAAALLAAAVRLRRSRGPI
ncbi:MAG TPA: ABC transporter permease [Candidatus Angelobacter sp.]|nr:ABC transporter permease [Candidatus Angelobacter sp.]